MKRRKVIKGPSRGKPIIPKCRQCNADMKPHSLTWNKISTRLLQVWHCSYNHQNHFAYTRWQPKNYNVYYWDPEKRAWHFECAFYLAMDALYYAGRNKALGYTLMVKDINLNKFIKVPNI